MLNDKELFLEQVKLSVVSAHIVKISLGKPTAEAKDLVNIFARVVLLKDEPKLSFTFRYKMRDVVKNYTLDEALVMLNNLLGYSFLNASLFTINNDYQLLYNKKRDPKLLKKAPTFKELPTSEHDKEKRRYVKLPNNVWLRELGIIDEKFQVIKSQTDKFRQINKYVEILDSFFADLKFSSKIYIVDMGAGKGYLTFALYDYLVNELKLDVELEGVEYQQSLVEFCNAVALKAGFKQLRFVQTKIEEYQSEKIDILIALHACDTATDDALAIGLKANAKLMMVAPCCHKYLRQRMDCQTELQPLMRFGLLEERQAEMLTDGLRALILESKGYKTKVFEFISSENTGKNVMITASLGQYAASKEKEKNAEIDQIKKMFGIPFHYLEKLLSEEGAKGKKQEWRNNNPITLSASDLL